jgi:hypothetical protein
LTVDSLAIQGLAYKCPGAVGLRTFNNAVVAFRTGAKCLKRFLVSLAFVGREGDIVAVEFDKRKE